RRFIAYGLLQCWEYILGTGCESIDGNTADVYWLRVNFLKNMQLAIDALPEMIEQAVQYEGDQDDSGPVIPLKRQHWKGNRQDDNELRYQWRFERLDRGGDPCLLFVLTWGEADDFSIWLRLDAVNEHAVHVLKEAVEWNNTNRGQVVSRQDSDVEELKKVLSRLEKELTDLQEFTERPEGYYRNINAAIAAVRQAKDYAAPLEAE